LSFRSELFVIPQQFVCHSVAICLSFRSEAKESASVSSATEYALEALPPNSGHAPKIVILSEREARVEGSAFLPSK
jgi:hypothetical protein